MEYKRRHFLKILCSGTALGLLNATSVSAIPNSIASETPLSIILQKNYRPPTSQNDAERLKRATLQTLEKYYGNRNMPIWKKPFSAVDMEVRINWIVEWLMKAVKQHENVYPVDPVLLMAMIMKESYFYEYAVSFALAVGICQFVQPTAQEYNMLCAGTRSEHGRSPYRLPNYSSKVGEYYKIRRDRQQYRRNNRPKKRFTLNEALQLVASERASVADVRNAKTYLNYLDRLKTFDEDRKMVREQFQEYLRANVENRNLFNKNDLNFILGFDERFTYKKPLSGMALMMARHLRARNGNVLSSVVGYNAGLSTTKDIGRFEPFGKIPYIKESVTYISHVLVNHYEISLRL